MKYALPKGSGAVLIPLSLFLAIFLASTGYISSEGGILFALGIILGAIFMGKMPSSEE